MSRSRNSRNEPTFHTNAYLIYFILQIGILLAVYLVYIGVVRLPLFSDDTVLIPVIKNRTLLTIFENRPVGDGHHRPMNYVPWLIVRDLLGWFIHPVLHLESAWFHVLNTALVGGIARRLAQRLRLPAFTFALISSLAFGLYPLSYEAIVWASALTHPVMALFGLGAVLVYLAAPRGWPRHWPRGLRFVICTLLLLGSCLSHETGFIFAILLLLVELAWAYAERRRIDRTAIAITVLGLLYPVYYRFGLITKWNDGAASFASEGIFGLITNAAYHAQSMLGWLLIPLRPLLGNPSPDAANLILLIGLVGVVGLALILVLRLSRTTRSSHSGWWLVALVGLVWWGAAAAPSTVALSISYVTGSPRLMYISVIGVALFWGAMAAAIWHHRNSLQWRVLRVAMLTGILALAAICVPYIEVRIAETARLKPMLNILAQDVKASAPGDRFLYINYSFLNLPNQPLFLMGQEGLDYWGFTEPIGPMWAWAASADDIQRETDEVRIDALLTDREINYGVPGLSFTRGSAGPFKYAVFGPVVDEVGLREAMLKSNHIYRFDYDAPGFRMRRVGSIISDTATSVAPPLARLQLGEARTTLQSAAVTTCQINPANSAERRLIATLVWRDTTGMNQPVGIFVHGMNAAGQQVLVADYDLLDGALPLEDMPAQTVITETRELRTSEPVTELRIGIYTRGDNRRFTALRDNDLLWEGEEIVIPITPNGTPNPLMADSDC